MGKENDFYFTSFEIALNSGAADDRVSSNKIDSQVVIIIPSYLNLSLAYSRFSLERDDVQSITTTGL